MSAPGTAAALAGRYLIFSGGRECGEDRWRLRAAGDGWVLEGEQVTGPPHPHPSRQEYRATLSDAWRVRGLEIVWTVGERVLRALHADDGGTWRVQIEAQGQRREQHGDFPAACEVEYGMHLFHAFVLARRDFALGGEHEFPALRIGPPLMAVTPEHLRYRCVETGAFEGPEGRVPAKRYVLSLAGAPEEEGYTFWADEDGFVLESFDGLDTGRTWMKLVELTRTP